MFYFGQDIDFLEQFVLKYLKETALVKQCSPICLPHPRGRLAPVDDDDYVIGKMLQALRRSRKVSQTTVAAALEVPQTIVSRIERGERRITLREMRLICELLQVPMVSFVAKYLDIARTGSVPSEADLRANLLEELVAQAPDAAWENRLVREESE